MTDEEVVYFIKKETWFVNGKLGLYRAVRNTEVINETGNAFIQ